MTYRYEIKDNRLYLYCVCDSTLMFLGIMQETLNQNGFTDIKSGGCSLEEGDERIPKDKPWCSYEFECSGVFPNNGFINKFDKPSGFITINY